jgi:REP element-mobilizing transposase RayT
MRDRLFVHLVWTTRGRQPLIDADAARYLVKNLSIIARQERARVLEIGIVATHLHLVLKLHPSTCIPRLMQRMKGGTAFGVNRRDPKDSVLRWAKGYNIASISERALDRVAAYVRDQHLRHPNEAIPGWPVAEATARLKSLKGHEDPTVASATPAEPRL